jgi:hypothetical protein
MKRTMIDLTPKLTAKVHPAESVDGEPVILKLTDKHEVEVLPRLQCNESTKQGRIIPLLDVVGGTLMVLPLRTPLWHFFLDLALRLTMLRSSLCSF